MKPESKSTAQGKPSKEPFPALGIPEEWVDPLQELGYDSVDKIMLLICIRGFVLFYLSPLLSSSF